ncbi:MAG: DUF1287 domain-containing protein [Pseudoxanthomonas sp.]
MNKSAATFLFAVLAALCVTSCGPDKQSSVPERTADDVAGAQTSASLSQSLPVHVRTLVEATRARTSIGEIYDPSYFTIPYPGGDVPNDRGVCTDVVVRAYRVIGIDLQVQVHEDMRANFKLYPKLWGLRGTDRSIDHRRVPNLETFLQRKGAALPPTNSAGDYKPGDLVTWRLNNNLPHIGIVSDRRVPRSDRPLILHNIGGGTSEDDILFSYPVVGHFRYYPDGT